MAETTGYYKRQYLFVTCVLSQGLEMRMTLLAPQDVAKRLRLSTSRVVQLDREGVLPALRDSGGRRFYDAEIVEQFATRREHAHKEPAERRHDPELVGAAIGGL